VGPFVVSEARLVDGCASIIASVVVRQPASAQVVMMSGRSMPSVALTRVLTPLRIVLARVDGYEVGSR
jgi:hypothetical protein